MAITIIISSITTINTIIIIIIILRRYREISSFRNFYNISYNKDNNIDSTKRKIAQITRIVYITIEGINNECSPNSHQRTSNSKSFTIKAEKLSIARKNLLLLTSTIVNITAKVTLNTNTICIPTTTTTTVTETSSSSSTTTTTNTDIIPEIPWFLGILAINIVPSENTIFRYSTLDSFSVNMATKTFKDTYDYILIDSGSPDSYLSSSEVDTFYLNASSSSSSAVLINATLYGDSNGNNTLLLLNNGSGTITLDANNTNSTEDIGELIVMAATSIVLGLMILITVIGNVFVIAAIILERNLQNVANYLVASLAVADLFVACLVMPLGAVYEISKGWILGPELCDIWTSCDVLCCTASILHLVAIATDRYWAVTNVDYIHSRTSRRVFTMIFLVWFAAVIVSLAPQFGWKDPEYLQRIEQQKCMVSQDVSYQVFATCCTFYVPLLVILVLYWKIYQTARKRIHRRRPRPVDVTANNNQPVPQKRKTRLKIRLASKFTSQGKSAVSSLGLVEGNSTNTVNTVEDTEYSSNVDSKKGIEVTTFNNADEAPASSTSQISTVSHLVANQTNSENQNLHQNQIPTTPTSLTKPVASATKISTLQQHQQQTAPSTPATTPSAVATIQVNAHQSSNQVTPLPQHKQQHNQQLSSIPNPQSAVSKRKETLEAKRERKAAKTLAIITGAFVVCWLPFFLMALLLPLCESCYINDTIASLFLWLGYFNSTLNPVIYTIFSPEFRQAFKRILFGGHRPVHYRSGKI